MFWTFGPAAHRSALLQNSAEHFLEVQLESYNTRFFHIKEDFAFTEVDLLVLTAPEETPSVFCCLQQVNGRKLYQAEDGVQLTVIDGHDGKVVESRGFRNSILQGIPTQIDNYVSALADG